MGKILILNGPNLNLLGLREPELYGATTLAAINADLAKLSKELQLELITYQSNAENQLLEHIQKAPQEKVDFIIINPAAFTHTSIALRDALLAVQIPFIEVHLSNIHSREFFRHYSYFSDIAIGVISGLGEQSYGLALRAAHQFLQQNSSKG